MGEGIPNNATTKLQEESKTVRFPSGHRAVVGHRWKQHPYYSGSAYFGDPTTTGTDDCYGCGIMEVQVGNLKGWIEGDSKGVKSLGIRALLEGHWPFAWSFTYD